MKKHTLRTIAVAVIVAGGLISASTTAQANPFQDPHMVVPNPFSDPHKIVPNPMFDPH
jgi:hypothetical protein